MTTPTGTVTEVTEASPATQSSTSDVEQDIALLNHEVNDFFRRLCVSLKNGKDVDEGAFQRLAAMIIWLENLQLRPTLRAKTQLHLVLGIMFKPEYKFPGEYQVRARVLYNRFEAEGWGEQTSAPAVQQTTPVRSARAVRRARTIHTPRPTDPLIKPVPADHPIWGVGIMKGCALRKNKRGVPVLNPELDRPDFRVFGHNGLTVGDWWPFRVALLASGGHGATQGGISGTTDLGTYSIVVAETYSDLDKDLGDTLHYAGSGSHENENPVGPAESKAATKSLHRSANTGEPVRVFRAFHKGSTHGPSLGIRYDGLYKVVSFALKTNNLGGKYEQFKLCRCDGQPAIRHDIPTAQQRAEYLKIKDGY